MFQTNVVQQIKTHTSRPMTFRKSCHLGNNVEDIVEPHRPQMKIWRIRNTCCVTKATDVRSEYVILIACPRQRATMLRYTYTVCLVNFTLRVTLSQNSEGLNYTAAEVSGSRIVKYVDGRGCGLA